MAEELEFPVYEVTSVKRADLKRRFTYHSPNMGQKSRYASIRDNAHNFATMLVSICPESRELSLALTKLEETVMWANASIARNESEPDGN